MKAAKPDDDDINALGLTLMPMEGSARTPSLGLGTPPPIESAPLGVCPHCNYRRRSSDKDAPDWQCPRCLTAYDSSRLYRPSERALETPAMAPTARAAQRQAEAQARAQAPLIELRSGLSVVQKRWLLISTGLGIAGGALGWKWNQRQTQQREARQLQALDLRAEQVQSITTSNTVRQQIDALEQQWRLGKAEQVMPQVRQLAESGDTRAMVLLAMMLLDARMQRSQRENPDGRTIAQPSTEQALEWLERAARSGEMLAMVQLGSLHERGPYTEREPARAEHWYFQAARQGYAPALYSLAQLYARGQPPVDRRPMAAYMLFLLAERSYKDNPRNDSLLPAQSAPYSAAAARQRLGSTMTESDLKEATHRADVWQPGMALGL